MDSGPVSTFQVHEYLRPKVRFLLFLNTEPKIFAAMFGLC
jgi:hypothetical protein